MVGIYNRPCGVEVYALDTRPALTRSIKADYCICTIPLQVLKNIDSNFSQPLRDAIATPFSVSTGKIGLQYRRRCREEDEKIYGGVTNTNTNIDLGTIWYPSHGYLGKTGVVVGGLVATYHTAASCAFPLVTKLQLRNPAREAPASRAEGAGSARISSGSPIS